MYIIVCICTLTKYTILKSESTLGQVFLDKKAVYEMSLITNLSSESRDV